MRTAWAAVTTLLAASCLGFSAAASDGYSRFHADVEPSAPLVFQGQISTNTTGQNSSAAWSLPPQAAPEFAFASNSTRFVVAEYRSGLVPVLNKFTRGNQKLELRELEYLRGAHQQQEIKLGAYNLSLKPRAGAELSLPAPPRNSSVVNRLTVSDAKCLIERDGPILGSQDPATLRAACTAPQVRVEGRAVLRVINTTVTLTYDEVENGTSQRRTHTYETGTFTEPDPYVPGQVRVGVRVVYVSLLNESLWLELPSLALTLRSTALPLQGVLEIPASEGTIEWDEQPAEGSLLPLRLEGTALAWPRPGAEEGIVIQALTANHPSAPQSGNGPVLSGGFVVSALAASLLGGLMALAWKFRLAFLGLFTRITEDSLLGHRRRRLLLQAVEEHPGITVGDAARLLGLSRSVVQHHVNVLARSGVLARMHVGRLTALFLPRHSPQERPRLQLMRNPLVVRLLAELRAHPDLPQVELGQRLQISQAHVSRLLRRIREVGLLTNAATGPAQVRAPPTAPWRVPPSPPPM